MELFKRSRTTENTRAPLPYHDLGSQRGFVQREPTPRHLAEWETAWLYALRGGGPTCRNVDDNVAVGAARASARTVRNVGGKVALHNAIKQADLSREVGDGVRLFGMQGGKLTDLSVGDNIVFKFTG